MNPEYLAKRQVQPAQLC